jgi:hypothetical protein
MMTMRPRTAAASKAAVEDVHVGDRRNRVLRPGEVDPRLAVLELTERERTALARRDDGRDAAKPALGVGELAQHPAGLVGQVRGAGDRVDLPQHLLSAEHRRAAPAVALGRREHRAADGAERVEQREVLVLVLRRLGELDVEDDLVRAGLVQPAGDLRVQVARQRPALLELVEADVVDVDEHDVVHALGGAHGEALVDAVGLEAVEERRQVREQAHRHGEDRREREAATPGALDRGPLRHLLWFGPTRAPLKPCGRTDDRRRF